MKNTPVQHEETKQDTAPRRSFLNWLWVLLGSLACIELGWMTGSILKSRNRKKEQAKASHIINAGSVADFKPGSVKAVPSGQFYLACLDDGSFIALSRTCTHLGCSVPWDDKQQKFICPCHGSTFDLAGRVLTPPALRPLDYFPVRIENGLLRVDITTQFKRDVFDPSQTAHL